MHLEEVILDGFKSYATRTVISGFDPKFNAITGLNGSGKSNILDAICFVLGISNLSQVRASTLQELVYKQGQAGITKASVTIIFNNEDTAGSPVGYETYDKLSITRQVIIGGRNKYLINGHTAQLSQIHNLFHSVQLNVNNPHFLIMQGRITKVLNMKPLEILSMIEETAGTRMYETKKQIALSTMEKKKKKVVEINEILMHEITPTLEKLRVEKEQYLIWAKNQNEIERQERFCIAFAYTQAANVLENAEVERTELKTSITEGETQVEGKKGQQKGIEDRRRYLQEQKERQMQGEFQTIKEKEESVGKELVKLDTQCVNLKRNVQSEEETINGYKSQAVEIQGQVVKQKEVLEKHQEKMTKMDAEVDDKTMKLTEAEKTLHAVSAGLNADGDGTTSMAETLSNRKRDFQQIQTVKNQLVLKQKHVSKQVKTQRKEVKASSKSNDEANTKLTSLSQDVSQLQQQVTSLHFNPKVFDDLQNEQEGLDTDRISLQKKVDTMSARLSTKLRFDYKMPTKHQLGSQQVKGIIAHLIRIKDAKTYATALELAAGARLYHVVVDTETTGKSILKHGQLKRRVTFVPLNRIQRRTIPANKASEADRIAPGKVVPALSLVDFDDENIRPAVEYALGSTFVCDDIDVAKKVTFHKNIKTKSVTLEGDSFDPSGTLQGGSAPNVESVLLRLQDLMEVTAQLGTVQGKLNAVTMQIRQMEELSNQYQAVSSTLELKSKEYEMMAERVSQSVAAQLVKQLETAESELAQCGVDLNDASGKETELEKDIETLTASIANMNTSRESETQRWEGEIKKAKKAAQKATAARKALSQEQVVLSAGLEQYQNELKMLEDTIVSCEEGLVSSTTAATALEMETAVKQQEHAKWHAKLETLRKDLSVCDTEMKTLSEESKKLDREMGELELEARKISHKLSRLLKDHEASEQTVNKLMEEHAWIASERNFFGRPQTDYCFETRNPAEARKRLSDLKEEQITLGQKINKKVMGMIEKAEQEYTGLMSKKDIIENDKSKITSVIKELDMKKNEALQTTWVKVNKDFGEIFSTLLPGTNAKLDPTASGSILDGLQVKVAFGTVWKESLTELSGGQRSLLALSLILSLLMFKPAPIYILDEVDAALDLSHTQNIGQMIKRHFSHSQFLVVSLKEGMFNNANVVFRTKFVDGVSTVSRTVMASPK